MTLEKQQELKQNTVIPLIIETGAPIVLNKPADTQSGTGYTPGEGFTTPSTPVAYKGYAIQTETNTENLDVAIVPKIMKTLMCVEIPEPNPDMDTLEWDGKTYRVLAIDETKPGQVSFFYMVHIGA